MEYRTFRARNMKGVWYTAVSYVDDSGKRREKLTKSEAKTEKAATYEAMIRFGRYVSGELSLEKDGCSACGYAMRHFKGRLERHEYERSTYASNMRHIRAWERILGDKPLGKVTEKDIEDAIAKWFSDGICSTTVDKRYTALNEVFSTALRRGIVQRNPFDNVKRPKKRYAELNGVNERNVLDDIASTIEDLPLGEMKVAFSLALHTGMRRGEIAGLRWSDVDLSEGVLWVRNSIGADDIGHYEKPPKSNKPRDIAMTPYLMDLLSEWKEKTAGCYVLGGSKPINPDYITHRWTALADFKGWTGAAGKRLAFHDLRHTTATVLVSNGADVKTVQAVLGHSSAAITLDMYCSADANAKKDAARILARTVSGSRKCRSRRAGKESHARIKKAPL